MSRILYMGGHSILEYDDIRLFHSIGHEVFSLGSYIDPSTPHDPKRPALPEIPTYPDLRAAVDEQNQPDNLDAAKCWTPQLLVDWADIIIVAAFEWRWLLPQWKRWKDAGKRVIWRTIGQTTPYNEQLMAPLFADGLEIVRYSPNERNIENFAGETAMIRFYKDPADWYGWTGERAVVTNVTQSMFQRPDACNAGWFAEATQGLPLDIAGEGSEVVGGRGQISYDDMRQLYREARVYLYTGTLPAPYTLGFIEAAMTGIPIVSIGPNAWASQAHSDPSWFEAYQFAWARWEDPKQARDCLRSLLTSVGNLASDRQRSWALDEFGRDVIAPQWAEFLR